MSSYVFNESIHLYSNPNKQALSYVSFLWTHLSTLGSSRLALYIILALHPLNFNYLIWSLHRKLSFIIYLFPGLKNEYNVICKRHIVKGFILGIFVKLSITKAYKQVLWITQLFFVGRAKVFFLPLSGILLALIFIWLPSSLNALFVFTITRVVLYSLF